MYPLQDLIQYIAQYRNWGTISNQYLIHILYLLDYHVGATDIPWEWQEGRRLYPSFAFKAYTGIGVTLPEEVRVQLDQLLEEWSDPDALQAYVGTLPLPIGTGWGEEDAVMYSMYIFPSYGSVPTPKRKQKKKTYPRSFKDLLGVIRHG